MILLLKALLMGIVEGLTEFIPVSSTGHLIIVARFLDFEGSFAIMFQIVIQLGAILAVVFYFRKKIFESLKHLVPGQWGFKLWMRVFIAFLPFAVVGLIFDDFIERYLFSAFTVAITLIVGAIMMLLVEKHFKNHKIKEMDKMGGKNALLIGLAQCMALFPGMSRSASTIMGGMVTGLSAKAAAEFSFFVAIPIMFAATGYSLIKGFTAMTSLEWASLGVGFVVSFIVALMVVGRFLAYLAKRPLKYFAYYRLIAGVTMLVLILTGIV